jgi:hypothetical protein
MSLGSVPSAPGRSPGSLLTSGDAELADALGSSRHLAQQREAPPDSRLHADAFHAASAEDLSDEALDNILSTGRNLLHKSSPEYLAHSSVLVASRLGLQGQEGRRGGSDFGSKVEHLQQIGRSHAAAVEEATRQAAEAEAAAAAKETGGADEEGVGGFVGRMRTAQIVLEAEEQAEAASALLSTGNQGQVLADYGDVQLTRENIACLNATEWLNDEVINKYMHLLNHRAGSCFHAVIPDGLDRAGVHEHYGGVASETYYKAWFCDTFFMEKLYVSLFLSVCPQLTLLLQVHPSGPLVQVRFGEEVDEGGEAGHLRPGQGDHPVPPRHALDAGCDQHQGETHRVLRLVPRGGRGVEGGAFQVCAG